MCIVERGHLTFTQVLLTCCRRSNVELEHYNIFVVLCSDFSRVRVGTRVEARPAFPEI